MDASLAAFALYYKDSLANIRRNMPQDEEMLELIERMWLDRLLKHELNTPEELNPNQPNSAYSLRCKAWKKVVEYVEEHRDIPFISPTYISDGKGGIKRDLTEVLIPAPSNLSAPITTFQLNTPSNDIGQPDTIVPLVQQNKEISTKRFRIESEPQIEALNDECNNTEIVEATSYTADNNTNMVEESNKNEKITYITSEDGEKIQESEWYCKQAQDLINTITEQVSESGWQDSELVSSDDEAPVEEKNVHTCIALYEDVKRMKKARSILGRWSLKFSYGIFRIGWEDILFHRAEGHQQW